METKEIETRLTAGPYTVMEEWSDRPWLMGADGRTVQLFNSTHPDSVAICAVPELLAIMEQAHRIFDGHTGKPNDPITGIEFEQREYMLDAMQSLLSRVRGPAVMT